MSRFCDTYGDRTETIICTAMLNADNCMDLKFVNKGYSYLEVDLMHASIERAMTHQKMYSTTEWAGLVGAARIHPNPYTVHSRQSERGY